MKLPSKFANIPSFFQDEVDDTRKTLQYDFYGFLDHATDIFPLSYAVSELWKDVEKELLSYPESDRDRLRAATKFGIFVVHNKTKTKLAELVGDTPSVTL